MLTGPSSGAWLLRGWLGVLLFSTCGWLCACNPPAMTLAPQQRDELLRRARDLLLRAAQSEDPELACNAIEALVAVAPEEGLPYFRSALRSESPLVRFAGLTALGTVRDRASVRTITSHLSDESPLVSLAAAYAACRCGDTARARVLVNALMDHPDENVRAEAAHLIGMLEEPRAVKRLRYALRQSANERSQRVTVQIYAALARLGDQDGVRGLIDYAQGDATTRLMALQGLMEAAAPAARDALIYRMNRRDEYLIHRLIAARALARLGSDAGYRLAMDNALYTASNPQDPLETVRVRTNAALALGDLRDPRALPVLRRLAGADNDPRVQVAACYAICRILQQ
jgi:HEAT repeat protein